jgi:hypothetical protein
MQLNPRRKLAIGASVLAACSFAGGAFAATRDSDAGTPRTFLNDVAKRLNVTPQQLTSALQGALADQLSAEVKAGRLTQAQANAIERQARRHGFLPFFLGSAHPFGPFGRAIDGPGGIFGTAAKYLGLSLQQLLDQLQSGKSLAQIAKARGKSAAGLVAAIVSAEQGRLDKARAAGRITASQEQDLLSRLRTAVQAMINGDRFGHPFFPHRLRRFALPGGAPPALGGPPAGDLGVPPPDGPGAPPAGDIAVPPPDGPGAPPASPSSF